MSDPNGIARFDTLPPPARDASDPLVGTIFAERYELTRLLGYGGMARVYEAKHRLIRRTVAVKLLHAELASDEELVRRFVNEGRAAGTIGHPHIAESLDMGIAPDGAPFLVFEYLLGRSLREVLRCEGPFSIERAVAIALQIASALDAAHQQGIIHCDVKPDNVVLVERDDGGDHAKVLDFGISKFRAGVARSVTPEPGTMLGTPEYMAPEQIGGDDEIDERTDVYGLGLLLHEMLTGRPPFEAKSLASLVRAVLMGRIASLAESRPAVPAPLRAILARAHARRREDRFGSMAELVTELSPFAPRGSTPPVLRSRVSRPSWNLHVVAPLRPSAPTIPTIPTRDLSDARLPTPAVTPITSLARASSTPREDARARVGRGAVLGAAVLLLVASVVGWSLAGRVSGAGARALATGAVVAKSAASAVPAVTSASAPASASASASASTSAAARPNSVESTGALR
jgi:serine/threonine-protein kinase